MKLRVLLPALLFSCPAFLCSQPELVWVPGGAFLMGDTTKYPDENPVHRVRLNGFYLAKTETTFGHFEQFVAATGYLTDAERGDGSYVGDSLGWHKQEGLNWRHDEHGRPRAQSPGNYRDYPVLHISWNDAVQYCNWLSEQQKLPKVYDFHQDTLLIDLNAGGYRLPTEAEWEYAAAENRPAKRYKYAGQDNLSALGWYSGNAGGRTHPAGQKRATANGLYDLCGNVWEWCHDRYDTGYYARSRDADNPAGPPDGGERTLRGGSWNNSGKHCRIANRNSRYPDFRDGSVGFRIMRPLKR